HLREYHRAQRQAADQHERRQYRGMLYAWARVGERGGSASAWRVYLPGARLQNLTGRFRSDGLAGQRFDLARLSLTFAGWDLYSKWLLNKNTIFPKGCRLLVRSATVSTRNSGMQPNATNWWFSVARIAERSSGAPNGSATSAIRPIWDGIRSP